MQKLNCLSHTGCACVQGSICTELISRLSEHGTQLARAVGFAAEVDCLTAMATAAHDFHWTRPVLTRDNMLDIRQGTVQPVYAPQPSALMSLMSIDRERLRMTGICLTRRLLSCALTDYEHLPYTAVLAAGRHPLTERVVELYVPNDTIMGPAAERLQVTHVSIQVNA